jgi:uncharacterized membrane protein
MKKSNLILIILTILVISLIPFISADPDDNYGCSMMYGAFGGYGTGMMVLSWITYITFITLILIGIYWLIKSSSKKK